jgi:small subunit ribosomal protein S1
VGDGIEGLVHISEMSAHHVDLPEQVVTPGEELWVKIIDLDLQRRRISLSIKQAAEGGIVASEYQEHFGEHAYDDEGNYIGSTDTGAEEAWAEYYAEAGLEVPGAAPAEEGAAPAPPAEPSGEATEVDAPPAEPTPEPTPEAIEAAQPEAAHTEEPAEG